MARAIVVLSCVTLSATRAELFGRIPVIIVVIVGFGACLFCCCKVPGIYRSCRETYTEGDDVEQDADGEDGEKRVSRHRPGHERKKKRGKHERQTRERSEKEEWWHKSASQLSQHFGGTNPMAAQRMKKKGKPKPAPPPPPDSLPEGWEEFFDDQEQRPYFHNAETGQTVWERPEEGSVPV